MIVRPRHFDHPELKGRAAKDQQISYLPGKAGDFPVARPIASRGPRRSLGTGRLSQFRRDRGGPCDQGNGARHRRNPPHFSGGLRRLLRLHDLDLQDRARVRERPARHIKAALQRYRRGVV
jgi:hypothetical protein